MERLSDRMDRLRHDSVVNVQPTPLARQESSHFQLLQMVIDGGFAQGKGWSQLTRAGFLVRAIEQKGQQLESHRIGQGLQAHCDGDCIIPGE